MSPEKALSPENPRFEELKPQIEVESSRVVKEQTPETKKQLELLESYQEYQPRGPRVGTGEVFDAQHNRTVTAEIYVTREIGIERYTLVGPNEEGLGYTELKLIDPSQIKNPEPNSPMQYYGNNTEDQKPYVWVELMMNNNDYKYRKVGRLLHEIAVERSMIANCNGRVQLVAGGVDSALGWIEPPATSLPFHESFGFIAKDVYNKDGSLHHEGQEIHERLAKERMTNRKNSEKYRNQESLQRDARSSWQPLASQAKPYFYLPEEYIRREQNRIKSGQAHLEATGETLERLLNRHHELHKKTVTTEQALTRIKDLLFKEDFNEQDCAQAARTGLELFQLGETDIAKQISQRVVDYYKPANIKGMIAFDLMEAAAASYVTGTSEQDNAYANELASRDDLHSYAGGPFRFVEQLGEIGCTQAAYQVYNRYEKTNRTY